MSHGKNAYKKNQRQQHRKDLERLRSTNPGQYQARLKQLFDTWSWELLRRLASVEPAGAFELFDTVANRAGQQHGSAFRDYFFSNHKARLLDEIARRVCRNILADAWTILNAALRYTSENHHREFHERVNRQLEDTFEVEFSRRLNGLGCREALALVASITNWFEGGIDPTDPEQVETVKAKVESLRIQATRVLGKASRASEL